MSSKKEILLLLISDLIAVNLAWIAYYMVRIESGWIVYTTVPSFLAPMIVIYFFWILIFSTLGLYQHWFVRSRLDEVNAVIKATFIGSFLLFFLIFIDDKVSDAKITSRFLIILYWLMMVLFTSTGRLIIRSMQKKLLRKGIGLKNTLIVGTNEKAKEINDLIVSYPELGYKLIGYIGTEDNDKYQDAEVGKLKDIKQLIIEYNIEEVLIASDPTKKDILMAVVNRTSDTNVRLKIMPELYEIISGMVKTQHIYGAPLIDVMPQLMTFRFRLIKRIIDIFFSLLILIIFSPLLIVISIIIKVTSKGPLIYIQKRGGKDEKLFNLYKFRSMVINSESEGPVWAKENDPRITPFGKFIRETRLDEFPQFWNVLINDMSIVGPRPERPYFVDVLKKEIPYYSRRFKVKPGITGWAQIKLDYDSSIEDVKSKLKYDFYYIENMSLTLDIRIILNTLGVIFRMKGH